MVAAGANRVDTAWLLNMNMSRIHDSLSLSCIWIKKSGSLYFSVVEDLKDSWVLLPSVLTALPPTTLERVG